MALTTRFITNRQKFPSGKSQWLVGALETDKDGFEVRVVSDPDNMIAAITLTIDLSLDSMTWVPAGSITRKAGLSEDKNGVIERHAGFRTFAYSATWNEVTKQTEIIPMYKQGVFVRLTLLNNRAFDGFVELKD